MNVEDDKKGPAVKVPPPLIFLTFLLIAYGIEQYLPFEMGQSPILWAISVGTITMGLATILHVAIMFRRAKTSIEPWKPTSAIITQGIYAYSRNPIYAGLCFVQIGLGFYLNSLWVVFSFLPAAILINHLVIKREECYLESKFGNEYLNYKERVRRWL
jgi:protein-S-isoprenylcysteine O-methyltransferase Ste14